MDIRQVSAVVTSARSRGWSLTEIADTLNAELGDRLFDPLTVLVLIRRQRPTAPAVIRRVAGQCGVQL